MTSRTVGSGNNRTAEICERLAADGIRARLCQAEPLTEESARAVEEVIRAAYARMAEETRDQPAAPAHTTERSETP